MFEDFYSAAAAATDGSPATETPMRVATPMPGRTVGLAWRQSSPRKVDFVALGQIVTETLGIGPEKAARGPPSDAF